MKYRCLYEFFGANLEFLSIFELSILYFISLHELVQNIAVKNSNICCGNFSFWRWILSNSWIWISKLTSHILLSNIIAISITFKSWLPIDSIINHSIWKHTTVNIRHQSWFSSIVIMIQLCGYWPPISLFLLHSLVLASKQQFIKFLEMETYRKYLWMGRQYAFTRNSFHRLHFSPQLHSRIYSE